MGRNGTTSTWLSGAFTVALALAFLSPAVASTDVYYLRPQANTHNNSYNSVSQTFVGTCDSVTKIAFFIGQNSGNSNYLMEIDSAGIAKGGVLTLSATLAKPYAENEGTYGSPVPVKRGYTYTLKFSRQTPSHKVDFYYLADTMAYPWGKITDPIVTGDLCGRAVGVNRTDSTYWGMNGEECGWGGGALDTMATNAKQIGINLDREQVRWQSLQPHPDSFKWAALDTTVTKDSTKGIRVMIDIYATPPWASSQSFSIIPEGRETSAWRYPPRNLGRPFGQQDSNFLWKFLDSLARHYSKKGVHDYEIWNETNYYDNWRYGIDAGDTCFYDKNTYSWNQSGRARLYVKACQVAWDAIKNADSQARVHTNAVLCMMAGNSRDERGREWMQDYYYWGGKAYADIIGWHWYLSPDANGIHNDTTNHRFQPRQFIAEYDTLRRIMRDGGDGAKPVWANEGGYGSPNPAPWDSLWSVSKLKQADIALQACVTGLGQRENGIGPALEQVNWYKLYDRVDNPQNSLLWAYWCGLLKLPDSSFAYKPSAYAYKQMTGKLKDKYFNRRVPLADSNVYAFEFEEPGSGKRTWVVWRADYHPADTVRIPVRSEYVDTTKIAYQGYPDSVVFQVWEPGGFAVLPRDSVPFYVHENGTPARPDIIVDSLYTYPSTPRAGDYVFFYARLKNIGNVTLTANLGNAVKFQVDGVTKATYTDSRAIMKDSTIIVGYSPWPPPGDGSIYDWKATWGDHLIKAWADSADKYVELREDNNQAYIFRHMAPSGKAILRSTGYNQGYPSSGRKFTNTRYDTLWLQSNGGTTPHADSVRIKNEGGSWKPWRRDSTYWRDTLPSGDGKKRVYAQWKMAPSETSASVLDSIILDQTAPNAWISSPAHGATISGSVPFYGQAYDVGGYFRFDTLKYHQQTTHQHDTIHVSLFPIGEMMPALLGTWNTNTVTDGLTRETLAVYDSAGNVKKDSITLTVYNNSSTDGGASWATEFGTYSSPVMNVATDPGGNVYLAETQNSKVRKYSPRKDSLFAFSARRGNDTTGLNWAVSMALKESTTLYIVDGYAHCTKAFDRQGNLLLRFGSFGSGPGQFKQPCGIALDHKGRVFVVDRLNHRVQVFSDTSGAFLFQFGSQGQDSGKFNSPTGIAITLKDTLLGIAQDLIWVSDTKNDQIQVFDSLGNYLKTIKQPDTLGFDTPTGICSDKWGDVYVADTKHNRIVELNPYGQRILDFGGLGDSLGQFRTPVGLASSPGAHYLYVADMGNRRVQRFTVILEDSSGGGPQSGEIVLRIPLVYSLAQSHPNPTTGEALIEYGLPQESPVRLVIYNVAGQAVREYKPGKQEAAFYTYKWDGRSNLNHKVGAGVYFYRLEAGTWAKTRKMVVIR